VDQATICPAGTVVVGPSNISRNDPVVHGVNRAARASAASVPCPVRQAATSRSSGA
jgi:hypothetical protein